MAPAPYADQLSFTAASGAGYIDVTAEIHTTGPVAVTVTATAGGVTVTLGSGTVNGWQTYSGRIEGLAGGQTYELVVQGGGMTRSKSIPVF